MTMTKKKERQPETRPSLLGGLISRDDETFEKILVKMLEPEKIETKTEVHEPVALTRLAMLSSWCEAEGVKPAAKMIRDFNQEFRVNMVSYKRQSRKEVVQALTEGLKQERTMQEKLMTKPS